MCSQPSPAGPPASIRSAPPPPFTWQDGQHLALAQVPHPCRVVLAAGGQQVAAGSEVQGQHRLHVTLQAG